MLNDSDEDIVLRKVSEFVSENKPEKVFGEGLKTEKGGKQERWTAEEILELMEPSAKLMIYQSGVANRFAAHGSHLIFHVLFETSCQTAPCPPKFKEFVFVDAARGKVPLLLFFSATVAAATSTTAIVADATAATAVAAAIAATTTASPLQLYATSGPRSLFGRGGGAGR